MTEPPFPPHIDGIFHGSAPATLRVIDRAYGVRFEIERPHRAPVVVDLDEQEIAGLVVHLTKRGTR